MTQPTMPHLTLADIEDSVAAMRPYTVLPEDLPEVLRVSDMPVGVRPSATFASPAS